ncbi:MAG: hypothetical protein GY952_10385 [Rhodobacteraceae bacterium]|nr:hypothetical protein [Paracoccaceae bacterium]
MSEPDKNTHSELDAFFDAARRAQPEPEIGLMNRILVDAADVLASRSRAPVGTADARPGFWRTLMETLGGWPGMSALTACAFAGLWIGFMTPDVVSGYSGGLIVGSQTETLDFSDLDGLEELLTES